MIKPVITSMLIVLALTGCLKAARIDLPVIKAKSNRADYRIGNDWVRGNWRISPQIAADSLLIPVFTAHETFVFYTDQDSIAFDLSPNEVREFNVLLNDSAMALTVVKAVKPAYSAIAVDTIAEDKDLKFWYEQNHENVYLNRLRAGYPIDSLVKNTASDTEKAMAIVHWVHSQWSHNGSNEPRKSDAISILEEVKEGKNFRCVEYGIVATSCLNAVGLKARILALKTEDVETRKSGAGHVLLEVYLDDLQKWALLDGQWDVMPVLGGKPLNAFEFQQAIVHHYPELEIRSLSNVSKSTYCTWVFPYLYYFDVAFDNRETMPKQASMYKEYRKLMLVPLGAKNPVVFQVRNPIKECLYTHSYKDFYAAPTSN